MANESRITKQATDVALSTDNNVRITKQATDVALSTTNYVRITKQTIDVVTKTWWLIEPMNNPLPVAAWRAVPYRTC